MNKYLSFVEACKQRLLDDVRVGNPSCRFNGTYGGRSYKHILANKDDRLELLMDSRLRDKSTCDRLFGGRSRFQAFSHHVNSSQILCINLFGPLLLDNPNRLRAFLQTAGIQIKGNIMPCDLNHPGSQFEYRPPIKRDRTNFDFYVRTDLREEVFFEVKYTESEFGRPSRGAKKPEEWEFYSQLCRESLYLKNLANNRDEFYTNFQVNRIIAHVVSEKQFCVFLFPHKNPRLKKNPRLNMLGRDMENCFVIHLEEVSLLAKQAFGENDALADYYRKLHTRYIGDNDAAMAP